MVTATNGTARHGVMVERDSCRDSRAKYSVIPTTEEGTDGETGQCPEVLTSYIQWDKPGR